MKNKITILFFAIFFYAAMAFVPNAAFAQTCQPSSRVDFKSTLLVQGSRGPDVGALQQAINSDGGSTIPVDCIFGPDTKRAVENFQRANDLSVDGKAGPQTLKALGLPVADTGTTGGGTGTGSGGGVNVQDCGGNKDLEYRDGVCQLVQKCEKGSLTCASSLSDLITIIIKRLLFFAGIIAVVFIIIGGFWYITSAGNEEQAEKGQKALTNAIIGVIVVVLSYVIVSVIANTLNSKGPTGLNKTEFTRKA